MDLRPYPSRICFPAHPSGGRFGLVVALVLAGFASGGVGATPSAAAPDVGLTRRNWRSHAGLPDDRATSIVQDSRGYVWAATHGGLARFNGWDFTAVTSSELPLGGRTRVRDLCAARDGSLWAVFDGNRLVQWKEGRVRIFSREQGLPGGSLTNICEDEQGAIYVGSFAGVVVRIRPSGITTLGEPEGLGSKVSGGGCRLAVDRDGQLWCANGDALKILRNGRFESVASFKSPEMIAPARDGGLWVATTRTVQRFRVGAGFSDALELPRNTSARTIHEDAGGTLWVGTRSQGLFRAVRNELQPVEISHSSVLGISHDREGNVWVATEGSGIEMIRPALVLPLDPEEPSAQQRWSVSIDREGTIWTVGWGDNLTYKRYGVWHRQAGFGPGGRRATAICAAPDGTIYVGGYNGFFRIRNGTVDTLATPPFTRFLVNCLYVSRNGDVWLGVSVQDKHHVVRYRDGAILSFPSPGNVRAFAENDSGEVFAGTAGGFLSRFDGSRFTRVPIPNTAQLGSLRALLHGADGSLWFGYAGGGLARFKSGHFVRVTPTEGLPDSFVSQLALDREGKLWIGCNRGLARLDPADFDAYAEGRTRLLRVAFFGRSEGDFVSQAGLGRQPSSAVGPDGKLYFTTHNHMLMVDPSARPSNITPPPVVLERMKVDGQDVSVEAVAPPRFEPGHTRIEIDYAALSFASPENVVFRHRLEGFDAEWIEAGARRQAVYSRLPAGNYRFRVIACNNDGVWNETGASLAFSVAPFLWETWWFHCAVVACALSLGLIISRRVATIRFRRKLQELEQQQAVARDRARIAQDMHDDLGSSLMHLALLSELAKGAQIDPAQKEKHLDKIGDSARSMVKTLDQLVWAVNPRNDTLPEVASYLGQHAVDFLHAANVRCLLEIPDELPSETVPASHRHNLLLATREALHNIVKHAKATEARFRLLYSAPNLTVEIADDGRGFDPTAASPTGDGLGNFKQRMLGAGGECEIDSSPGRGTTITFRLTLKASTTESVRPASSGCPTPPRNSAPAGAVKPPHSAPAPL